MRGADCVYLPAHVPAGRLAEFLSGVAQWKNLAGLCCTIPHKQEAARLARCDQAARRASSNLSAWVGCRTKPQAT